MFLIKVFLFFSGQSLNDAGESFKRLAEVKYSLEENVKQNFLEPLSHLQSKDLKEVNVSKLSRDMALVVDWNVKHQFKQTFIMLIS